MCVLLPTEAADVCPPSTGAADVCPPSTGAADVGPPPHRNC